MSMIQTVLGPVAPEKLGLTTMHEHVLCDVSDALAPMVKAYRAKIPTQSLALVPENLASLRSGMSVFSQECCPAGDVAYTVREFRAFQAMGGGCVVDASPASMRKDLPAEMEDLREASRQSGVHVVTCTGLYVADAQPEAYKAMDEDALAAAFEADMVKGIDDQSKAGFLKCAINTLTPVSYTHLDVYKRQLWYHHSEIFPTEKQQSMQKCQIHDIVQKNLFLRRLYEKNLTKSTRKYEKMAQERKCSFCAAADLTTI